MFSIRKSITYINKNPKLKRFLLAHLTRYPALKSRLRKFVWANNSAKRIEKKDVGSLSARAQAIHKILSHQHNKN